MCRGAGCYESVEIKNPKGWKGVSGAELWCPNCRLQNEFLDAQCGGCVSGWGDSSCPLFCSYAYEDSKGLPQAARDFLLTKHCCPFRSNGTFMVSQSPEIEQLDLSDQPSAEAAAAMVAAIDKGFAETQLSIKKRRKNYDVG